MANEDIVVTVGGDVSALKRGMDRGARDVKKFGNITRADLKRTAARFAKFGAAAAAAAAAAGGLFAREALKSADAIRKLSIRTGVATDALQELNHAYNLAGVEQQAFNNGLETFGKRLGKARDGFGALKEGLRGSNEQLLQTILASNDTTEALELVFEAMGKATNEAQRLAIADAAFGGVGLKMTSAFEDGAEAFDKARQEAHDLGLVISEDLLKNAEKLNDDFAKASGMIKTQLAAAFLELAPAISAATQKLIDFLTEMRGLDKLLSRFGNTLTDRLVIMKDEARDLDKEIKSLQERIKKSQSNAFFALNVKGELEKLADLEEDRRALGKKIALIEGIILQQKKETTKETEKQADAEKKITAQRKARTPIQARRPFTPERQPTGGLARPDVGFNLGTAGLIQPPTEVVPGIPKPDATPISNNIQKMIELVDRLNQRFSFEENFEKQVTRLQHLRNLGVLKPGVFDRAMQDQIRTTGAQLDQGSGEDDITAQKIEAIKERFKTMEELEVERFEREQALLEERMATETEKQQEHLELLEKLQKEHGKNMADLREDKAKREQAIEARNRQVLVSGAQNLISEIGRINDDMFRQAQIAGAALAMVNALVAASEILKNTSTWDFTAGVKATAAALQVLATGIGFVNAIKSTKPGGGGAVVGAGGVPATPTQEQGGEPTRNVFINVRGASRDTRAAIEAINEEIKDGSKLAGISAS